jgi:hypothetical protein
MASANSLRPTSAATKAEYVNNVMVIWRVTQSQVTVWRNGRRLLDREIAHVERINRASKIDDQQLDVAPAGRNSFMRPVWRCNAAINAARSFALKPDGAAGVCAAMGAEPGGQAVGQQADPSR